MTVEGLDACLMIILSLSVTGIDVDVACVIIFIVCIFYTAAVRERTNGKRGKTKIIPIIFFAGRNQGRHVDRHLPSGRHVRLLPGRHHKGQLGHWRIAQGFRSQLPDGKDRAF